MRAEDDSARAEFWTSRYNAGETPWDFHGVPSALEEFLGRSVKPGRVLVPGCGFGYEVKAFLNAGFTVTAIDFSPAAVKRTRHLLGLNPKATIYLADFFKHDFSDHGFDLIYERTFLCSLAPSLRPEYADKMARLLRPGKRLIGFFFYGSQSDPPPYAITRPEVEQLLGDHFELIRDDAVSDSLPLFKGMERWQEWRRL